MCKICEIKSVYEFTNKRKLCKLCFVRWFEKKVFYTIRKFDMINSSDEKISYICQGDFRDVVLEEVLKIFSKRVGVDLNGFKILKSKSGKIVLSITSDYVADGIVNNLIQDKVLNLDDFLPVQKVGKTILVKPLYLFLDKEVFLYAKLKGLKFKEVKKKQDKVNQFIESMKNKHPELSHSVVSSLLECD